MFKETENLPFFCDWIIYNQFSYGTFVVIICKLAYLATISIPILTGGNTIL